MEPDGLRETLAGTPQGGVISPLLANIYLNAFDRLWDRCEERLGVLVRYADDFVIMSRSRASSEAGLVLVREIMDRLGLELHPEKTKLVNLSRGEEGFDFLGWHIRKRRSIQRYPRKGFVQRWPSKKAQLHIRRRVGELTSSKHSGKHLEDLIVMLNPVLRGWGQYFRTGNSDRKFNQIDDYVHDRLTHWLRRRGGQRAYFDPARWPHARFRELGLHQLRTFVKYPAQATPRRPLVSRVRENRMHGLKGDPTFPSTRTSRGR
jgi:RNA-directed DNA polymerase